MRLFPSAFFALGLFFALAAPASAATPIADTGTWVSETMAILKDGDLGAFQKRFTDVLGDEMVTEVTAAVSPFVAALGDTKAVYLDRIDAETLGTSFEIYTYAVYLGNREFVFVSVTFARVEDGMTPFAFFFGETLGDVR